MASIGKQQDLNRRITNSFTNFKKLGKNNMSKGACLTRVQQLKELWIKFDSNHEMLLEDEEVDMNDAYYKNDTYGLTEESYLNNLGAFQDYLLSVEKLVSASHSTDNPIAIYSDSNQTKLPEVELPTFSGDVKDWVKYRETFIEMIVKRTTLPNVYKMHYLKTTLKGEAAELLEEIPPSGENFEDAWQTVKKFYNNNRLLTTKLLSKLMSMKPMSNGSAQELNRIRSGTKNILQALKALGSPVDAWDHFTVFLTTSKLTPLIQRKWEEKVANSSEPETPPTFNELDKYLDTERLAQTQLESAKEALITSQKISHIESKNKSTKTVLIAQETKNKPYACPMCKGEHRLYECKTFCLKTPQERREIVINKHRCFNCLANHRVQQCKSSYKCQKCFSRHHSLLHLENNSSKPTGFTQAEIPSLQSSVSVESKELKTPDNVTLTKITQPTVLNSCLARKNIKPENVLLATAWIHVQAENGRSIGARALIDQGAQSSFISEELCQTLKLQRKPVHATITGVGKGKTLTCRSEVTFNIRPHFISTFSCGVSAFVIPSITAYKSSTISTANWPHLKSLEFADPKFSYAKKVDILLGAEVHAQIIEEGLRKIDTRNAPIAMKTLLGWIVSGSTNHQGSNISSLSANLQVNNLDLNDLLRKFWETEEIPSKSYLTQDEQACEDFYISTVSHNESGRYVVRLPFKKVVPSTWEGSYSLACRSLRNLEYKFEKDLLLKDTYIDSMKGYISLQHMRRVTSDDPPIEQCFFLPHHGVIKESSTTTKLRTVFNASAKTKGGYALNDFLHIGANLLNDSFDLITRWRQYLYAFSADIEKMFRQIGVHKDDQHFQALVWREKQSDEIQSFFMTTVTFGFACSPFLAHRTIKQLARDEADTFPLGSQILTEEIYVDEVLSGDFTLEGAKVKQEEVIKLLQRGGFNLRKWIGNETQLIKWLPSDTHAGEANFKVGKGFSVLGIAWNPITDCFYYNLNLESLNEPITRRTVLAKIAKLYDPLGWISPVIVALKIFMQSLWALTKEWDEDLPEKYIECWIDSYSSLKSISQIRIPRWIGIKSLSCKLEIHGFADASKTAYAGVVFLRIVTSEAQVYLLGSKTKVAPVKTLSIPRLELCAAQLTAKLVRHFYDILKRFKIKVHLWSDSKDVLFWLKDIPARWPTFIANRCANIAITLPDASWHHINSADNPADIASRGCIADELITNDLWWRGPKRLRDSTKSWSCNSEIMHNNQPKEVLLSSIEASTSVVSKEKSVGYIWPLVYKYSTLSKLIRITCIILKFVRHTLERMPFLEKISRVIKDYPLTADRNITSLEVRQAKFVWCYLTQIAYFPKEIQTLREGGELPKNHHLQSLFPQFRDGLIRVGGRLKHSTLNEDEKFPVILPYSCIFSELVVRYYHHLSLHGGVQRFNSTKAIQLMGDLPPERVKPSRPFLNSGVDYAGPYLLRTSRHRGYKSYKGYFIIFICLSTKAVHLEAVSSYDTEGFISAFRRFVARRGPCLNLFSDQGTNLVGADAELRLMHAKGSEFSCFMERKLNSLGTSWHFNPPGAPHFGGIWEAAVRSTKYHLKRIVGETILTFEEFSTLLCQIEACLNSRPLVPLNEDTSENFVLTPAHFLIGESSLLITEPRITDEKISPMQRWRRMQQFTQRFWDCWSSDYLHQLQKRTKWKITQPDFKVNDVVLLRNETTAPTRWPLARIIQVFPGSDGRVRVMSIRTATTTLRRPISKLVKLIDGNQELIPNQEEAQKL